MIVMKYIIGIGGCIQFLICPILPNVCWNLRKDSNDRMPLCYIFAVYALKRQTARLNHFQFSHNASFWQSSVQLFILPVYHTIVCVYSCTQRRNPLKSLAGIGRSVTKWPTPPHTHFMNVTGCWFYITQSPRSALGSGEMLFYFALWSLGSCEQLGFHVLRLGLSEWTD